jgi:mRNA interferase RelE/StbE
MWELVYSRDAQRSLRELVRNDRERIVQKLKALAVNPQARNVNVAKMKGSHHYRLRIGDWRVIFDLNTKGRVIEILVIKSRGSAYR